MASLEDKATFKWATVTGVNPIAIRIDGDTTALALIPDSLIDPLSLVVGDRVRVELSLRRVVIHGVNDGGSPAGEVRLTAAATAPNGWLLCQGQSLSRTQYPRLFAALGTAYGAASSLVFNLPDMRGRVAVGRDSSQVEFDVLGEAGGAKTHTLSVAEMPNHNHSVNQLGYSGSGYPSNRFTVGFGGTRNTINDIITDGAGSGQAHNNLQPYLTLNYIIKI